MKRYKMFARMFLFAAVILTSAACSQVNFTPTDPNAMNGSQSTGPSGPGGPGGTTCSGSLGTTHVLTKMLFIVDQSGSNQSAAGCTVSATCTDPGKRMRGGSIQSFFNDYGSKTNFQWSFDVFSGTTS